MSCSIQLQLFILSTQYSTYVLVLNEDRGFSNSFFLFSASNSPEKWYNNIMNCRCANSMINTFCYHLPLELCI